MTKQTFSHPDAPGIIAKNPFCVAGNTAVITLTQGKTTTIDLADLPLVAQRRWCAHNSGYANNRFSGRLELLHRFLMDFPAGGLEIDHINGDRSDNRRSNLRFCTRSQNNANRKVLGNNNKSGFKGVCQVKSRLKETWVARITKFGDLIHLGHFSDRETAAHAYDAAAIKYHGDFARLNFPATVV